jgi:glutathione S-transferase
MERSEWIAGDAPSLADLFIVPIVHTASLFPEAGSALESCENLARALRSFAKRESFVAALPAGWTCP